jgi:hypothetical protein
VNKCINCKKRISKKAKRCKSCAKKGILNPSYKYGLSLLIKKCIDCNKQLGKHSDFYNNLRCRKCADTEHGKKLTGKNNPMYGIKRCGKKSPHWQGGKIIIKYNHILFNNELKESVRIRDNYKCQLCYKKHEIKGRKLSIHHIDYNKDNCKKKNLITLCLLCNLKVNANRDYWFAYFSYILERE